MENTNQGFENMDDKDIVCFQDDKGNEIPMEVIDYFNAEGKEYAIVCPLPAECNGCTNSCEGCESCSDQAKREGYVMEVVPVDDDMEEFVPVEDDKLAQQLFDMWASNQYDDDDDEEYEVGEDKDE